MNELVLFLLLTLTLSRVGLAGDNERHMTAKQTDFFLGLGSNKAEHDRLFKYCKVITQEESLGNADNKYVLKEFAWWMHKIIKDEYVPSDDFIQSHLLLFPANSQLRKEDVAMLSFQTLGTDYLIAQTGGPDGRIWIYTRSESATAVQFKGEADSSFRQLINSLIKDDYRNYIPDIETEDQQCYFVGKTLADLNGKMKNYVQYVAAGKDKCIVLQKVSFTDPIPGMMPQPDEWFSFSRQKTMNSGGSNATVKKTDYQQRRINRMDKRRYTNEVPK